MARPTQYEVWSKSRAIGLGSAGRLEVSIEKYNVAVVTFTDGTLQQWVKDDPALVLKAFEELTAWLRTAVVLPSTTKRRLPADEGQGRSSP